MNALLPTGLATHMPNFMKLCSTDPGNIGDQHPGYHLRDPQIMYIWKNLRIIFSMKEYDPNECAHQVINLLIVNINAWNKNVCYKG